LFTFNAFINKSAVGVMAVNPNRACNHAFVAGIMCFDSRNSQEWLGAVNIDRSSFPVQIDELRSKQ